MGRVSCSVRENLRSVGGSAVMREATIAYLHVSAWLMKVFRPWWMVSVRRRVRARTRQAVGTASVEPGLLSRRPKVVRCSKQVK